MSVLATSGPPYVVVSDTGRVKREGWNGNADA
jgi:hypothetical protein